MIYLHASQLPDSSERLGVSNLSIQTAGVGSQSSKIYTLQEFEEQERKETEKGSLFSRIASKCSKIQCSKKTAKNALYSVLPCIRIGKSYNLKEDGLADLVCGLTIGLVNIPLSMAYALLYAVPAVYALYTGFIPGLLYSFLATSNHVSFGTLAITGLLVGNSVNRILPNTVAPEILNAPAAGNYTDPVVLDILEESGFKTAGEYIGSKRVEIAIVIAFWAGIIQFLIGLLRLGHLTIYLADAMVAGYTTATVIYVFASQLKSLLGISFTSPTGYFNLFMTFYYVFYNIQKTNLASLLISAICITVLGVFKFIINPILIRKIRVPFPIEVLLVIIAIVISDALNLYKKAGVKIVGEIKQGLPPPVLPQLGLSGYVFQDSFVIAVVNYGVTISIAQVFARKHGYEVDANQEAIAYGLGSFVGSFFLCIIPGGSITRTAVQETMQARTQLVGFISAIIMMIVLLAVAPLFKSLPLPVLASIIAVGLFGVIEQFKEPYRLWHISKYDCLIWVVTFAVTCLLDVDIGLLFGLLFSFFVVVLRTQTPESHLLGNIPGTGYFKSIEKYTNAKELPSIKIYRYGGPIHFANSSAFRSAIYKKTDLNPEKMLHLKSKLERKKKAALKKLATPLDEAERAAMEEIIAMPLPSTNITHIIVELSTCPYIDAGGLRLVKQVIVDYKRIGVTVFLAAYTSKVRNIFLSADFFADCEQAMVYLSLQDAIIAATTELNGGRAISTNDVKTASENGHGKGKLNPVSMDSGLNSIGLSSEIIPRDSAISAQNTAGEQHWF